jgi:hypothetical protein
MGVTHHRRPGCSSPQRRKRDKAGEGREIPCPRLQLPSSVRHLEALAPRRATRVNRVDTFSEGCAGRARLQVSIAKRLQRGTVERGLGVAFVRPSRLRAVVESALPAPLRDVARHAIFTVFVTARHASASTVPPAVGPICGIARPIRPIRELLTAVPSHGFDGCLGVEAVVLGMYLKLISIVYTACP